MAIKQTDVALSDRGIEATKASKTKSILFDIISTVKAYQAGQITYDEACRCHLLDTGYDGVRVNAGRENHVEIFNNTATQINNGDPVSVNLTFTGEIPNVVPSDSSNIFLVLGFAGVATMDIPPGEAGLSTAFGLVNGVNTGTLIQGFIYLDDSGGYTQIRPLYPLERLVVGAVIKTGATDGVINVSSQHIPRRNASRSYTFTSADASAGSHYRAGFYGWASNDVTLTQSSLSVTHGATDLSRAAHIGIVASAAGTVDVGQVGIQVTGTLDDENGVQIASQTAVITDDITSLTTDMMVECLEKFSGEVEISLYVVSGSPTTYSATFNYGFSKYEDFANIDGTVTAFSASWEGGANDSVFNIELLYHNPIGWTYSASGFVPGDGAICERLVDQSIASGIAAGVDGAYKRINLNQFIDGSGLEGIILRITTGSTLSIRNMDMHVTAFSEELF